MQNLLKFLLIIFLFFVNSSAMRLINDTEYETIWICDKDINHLIEYMNSLKKFKNNSFRLYEELTLYGHYEIQKNSDSTILKKHEKMWFMCFVIYNLDIIFPSIVKKGNVCLPVSDNWNQE